MSWLDLRRTFLCLGRGCWGSKKLGFEEFVGARTFLFRFKSFPNDLTDGVKLVDASKVGNERSFTYEVARGVAEMQWRRQRSWLGCVQPKGCHEQNALGRISQTVQHVFEL